MRTAFLTANYSYNFVQKTINLSTLLDDSYSHPRDPMALNALATDNQENLQQNTLTYWTFTEGPQQ